ncbi:glutathione ABC transporter permease GsiD, partial [Burkholderia pseudomallei OB]|nr:glutathione ABC transporter permease GsiD [Burkholderia pseudomallei OB]
MNATVSSPPPAPASAGAPAAIRTPWSEFWRKFRKQRVALAAGAFVLLLVAVAIVGPHVVPDDPGNYFDYDALNPGTSGAPRFGVDSLGRDTLSRLVARARISLAAGFFSVALGAAIG